MFTETVIKEGGADNSKSTGGNLYASLVGCLVSKQEKNAQKEWDVTCDS